ncbi:tetratricopeptide repeat protein [Nostoc sp. NIES-2111]|nr:tetratricopeptide repeat protein [Nostoc sp. NIES-2111]
MKSKILMFISILFLQFPASALQKSTDSYISQVGVDNSACEIKPENGETSEYSQSQLKTLASRITLRVIGGNNGGSGTLIARRGNKYLVLTNNHVITGVSSVQIKTADGKTYSAAITPNTKFEKFDLALLEFQSNQNYCLQEVANFLPNTDTQVMAAGYSAAKGEIAFRTGIVQQIWDRPLKDGYQIGYTSDIEQGMSGGAIVNSRGEIIGINGRSAYPILNTGYVYPDGSRPSEEEIQRMRKLSWGIPISTLLAQVDQQILTAYSLPLPKSQPTVPTTQLTGWLGELELKAKQITVRIDSSSNANGSGIIIARNGDTYTVLTAEHVVCERQDATQPCRNYNYQILAPDGKQYPIEKSTIKTEAGVDLAVLKFTATNQSYQVATLANYNPNIGDYMFTAGYPKQGDNYSPWRLTMGTIFSKETGLGLSKISFSKTDNFSKLLTANSLTGAYELVYTSITYGGMSGGPVLDSLGRVIGIHGLAEGEQAIDEITRDFGSSRGQVQLGYSLGIPVSTFLGIATRLGVQTQKVETTLPPRLKDEKSNSIKAAIISTDIFLGNATASQLIERGNQLWRLGRYEEAVKAFDEAIKQKPSFVYLAYYGKGLALRANNKYQEATDALESATTLKSDFVAAWQELSVVYSQSKQPEKALVAIKEAIELQPKNPNLYNSKSQLLSNLEKYPEAEVAINKAIGINPRVIFYMTRSNIYAKQKKWELTLADLSKAIDISPHFYEAYFLRGSLYYNQKTWDLSLADFSKLIDIDSQYSLLAYIVRSDIYSKQKKWELALADLNKVITLEPRAVLAYIVRSDIYSKQKKWELALADLNKAIIINPHSAKAYATRGLIYFQQKKWELALADLNKAIIINPQLAESYATRGLIYFQKKKWELALADLNKAIILNPQFAEAYATRGLIYFQQKKWELALADLNKAIILNPQFAGAYLTRGLIHYQQKKWELALADLNKAITPDLQSAELYAVRGSIYSEQKKWELALADLNKAITLNPQLAEAYAARGVVYHAQKKYILALAEYNQALAKDEKLLLGINNIGLIKYEQGAIDEAVKQWQQAINLNNKSAEPHLALAVALYRKGEQETAYKVAQTALQLDKNFADINFLKENLWGEKIIADAQKLLSSPQIQGLLLQMR